MDIKARITNRIGRCHCGCKGSDPWHKTSFDRKISNVRDHSGVAHIPAFHGSRKAVRQGEAKFPWGEETVFEVVTEVKP